MIFKYIKTGPEKPSGRNLKESGPEGRPERAVCARIKQKTMKQMWKTMVTVTVAAMVAFPVKAQEEKSVTIRVNGDLVSSYVWRGAYNAGASVQPALGLNAGGFSFTVWGSKEISGPHKEIDLTAAYSFGRFGLAVTDYWWDGERYAKAGDPAYARSNKYFHFGNHSTCHYAEAGADYTVSDRFPLNIAWYTMFWGADKKADGGQNYSSYLELNCPFSVKGTGLKATVGISPYDSYLYGVSGFAVCNLALEAVKELKLSDTFSLPLFARLIFDPAHEDTHLVLGFTL